MYKSVEPKKLSTLFTFVFLITRIVLNFIFVRRQANEICRLKNGIFCGENRIFNVC